MLLVKLTVISRLFSDSCFLKSRLLNNISDIFVEKSARFYLTGGMTNLKSKILIITVISNETANELTIYAKLCLNVTIFYRQ